MGLTLCPCYYKRDFEQFRIGLSDISENPAAIFSKSERPNRSSVLKADVKESQVTQHEKLVDDVQKEAHGEKPADLTRSEFVTSKDQRTAIVA